jgi:hypothetical protein
MSEQESAVETFTKLATLALDEAASEEEARNSAVKALRILRDERLQVVTSERLDAATKAVEGARADFAKAREAMKRDATTTLVKGAIMGFAASKFLKMG